MSRARALVEWPTDGIPAVRPNLGVVFVPALAGLDFEIREGQMPWPGQPLDRDAIRAARELDLGSAEVETPDAIAGRIRELQRHIDIADLSISPDCA